MEKIDNNISYSIVIPVYNSAVRLSELLEKIVNEIKEHAKKFEIIFVDDYSSDQSWVVLSELKAKYNFVRIIRLSKNFGQLSSTFCGVMKATGKVVITIDDDFQYPPKEIGKLINHYSNNDYQIVYGVPRVNRVGIFRKLIKMVVIFLNRISYLNKYIPKGYYLTSFRIFNREKLIKDIKNSGLIKHFDIYLTWILDPKLIGFIKVEHEKRKVGKSGQTFSKRINDMIDIATCLYASPFKVAFYLSIIFIFLSFTFLILSVLQIQFYIEQKEILILIFFMIVGFLFILLGIIGIYLAKIYQRLRGKPDYFILEEK